MTETELAGHKELEQVQGMVNRTLSRELVFWGIRWIIGCMVVALIVAVFPDWFWLWYLVAGVAMLSLIVLLGPKFIFAKQLEKATNTVDQFQQALHIPEEEAIEGLIIGAWKMDGVSHGVQISGLTQYQSDGSMSSKGTIISDGDESNFSVRGTWHLEEKDLVWTVSHSENPEMFPLGSTHRETLLELTDQKMTYRDEGGEVWTECRASL